ncbi:general transcription factor IIE subunit 1 isoform X2 [Nerophis lumbriciformis]|uniref:general transcription factor IIE subunit 1 isoform X2 n=1 Tax=Nerophis lumbriciformis TaxID=546530 RepID=UPI002AE06AC2|nr:general transcription factor IIE subunit 1-like isoform X2 [Nerophis lumbriciformis]
MIEPELLTEVPAALKRLAKMVVRGFYGVEHALALDVLIRNPCVREEDMQELLKFDRKQLRSVLNTLKADKFVKCRMRVETAPDGKTTRHNYYFINYRVLVNVVKYKLDHMRRRIETDERDSTNRASFRCPCCFSTFTDLEANQLFDPMTGTFRCTFCQTEVEEDESVCPDARTLVARFNEQIEPIYVLLRETEDVNLSHDLLEPEPSEIPALKQSRERAAAAAGAAGGQHREAWSNKGSYADLYTQNVVINMEEQDDQQKQVGEGKAPKERPVWLTQSTVQGAYSDTDMMKNRRGFWLHGALRNPFLHRGRHARRDPGRGSSSWSRPGRRERRSDAGPAHPREASRGGTGRRRGQRRRQEAGVRLGQRQRLGQRHQRVRRRRALRPSPSRRRRRRPPPQGGGGRGRRGI